MRQKALEQKHRLDELSPQAKAHALAIARLLLLGAIQARGESSRDGRDKLEKTPEEKREPPPPSEKG